jgi:membrane fusion protein, copper/silver efflux system
MSDKSKSNKIVFACVGLAVAAGVLYFVSQRRGAHQPGAQATPESAESRSPVPGDQHIDNAGMPASELSKPDEPSTIFISPERQQLIGVRTAVVERKPLTREIRAVGKVSFDETKVAHIHTKVAGFVEDVFVDFVGKQVNRGDPLFTLYSPDLLATQNEYLLALRSDRELHNSQFEWISKGSGNLLDSARARLQLWDVSDEEIKELESSGKAKRALTVHSPVSGIVTQRGAYHHGKYVTPDMELYTIVDLSTVWVLGEVYEADLPFVRVGQSVIVELPYAAAKKEHSGKIAFISPTLNPATRTAEVRVEFSNPDLGLRPDMFVNFRVRVNLGSPLVIPSDALLDTGTEQYVFVDKGQGYFEPRAVKVSAEAANSYGVEKGIAEGERVVTAANFILDSESRLRGALAGMGTPTAPTTAPPPQAASQSLQLQVLEPQNAKVGMNSTRVLLKDATGKPITDAEVEITLFMPQMGSMAPMRSSAQLRSAGNGEYVGQIEVPMAWTWETTVTAKRQGQAIGSAKTNITAR